MMLHSCVLSASNNSHWCRMMISERPDVEAKICAELNAVGVLATPERPNPRPIELVDLNSLKYFDNVCKVWCLGSKMLACPQSTLIQSSSNHPSIEAMLEL